MEFFEKLVCLQAEMDSTPFTSFDFPIHAFYKDLKEQAGKPVSMDSMLMACSMSSNLAKRQKNEAWQKAAVEFGQALLYARVNPVYRKDFRNVNFSVLMHPALELPYQGRNKRYSMESRQTLLGLAWTAVLLVILALLVLLLHLNFWPCFIVMALLEAAGLWYINAIWAPAEFYRRVMMVMPKLEPSLKTLAKSLMKKPSLNPFRDPKIISLLRKMRILPQR